MGDVVVPPAVVPEILDEAEVLLRSEFQPLAVYMTPWNLGKSLPLLRSSNPFELQHGLSYEQFDGT